MHMRLISPRRASWCTSPTLITLKSIRATHSPLNGPMFASVHVLNTDTNTVPPDINRRPKSLFPRTNGCVMDSVINNPHSSIVLYLCNTHSNARICFLIHTTHPTTEIIIQITKFSLVSQDALFHDTLTAPKDRSQSLCMYSTISALQSVAFRMRKRMHRVPLTTATMNTQ